MSRKERERVRSDVRVMKVNKDRESKRKREVK